MNEREILVTALEIEEATKRRQYLDRACGNDVQLRERIESLLQSSDAVEDFLELPAPILLGAVEADRPLPTMLASRSAEELQGGVLGDFRIIREIARGGMGIVYEAEQISLGRQVAVKVLPMAGMLSANQLQRFKNEAKAAASLHHTNIVNAFFVGHDRGVHYYAMRLVNGKSGAEIIAGLRRTSQRGGSMPLSAEVDRTDGPLLSYGSESQGVNSSDAQRCDREKIANHGQPESLRKRDSTVTENGIDPLHSQDTRPLAALWTERSGNRREFYRSVARLGIQVADALKYAHSMGVVHRDIKPSNLLVDHDGHPWITDFGLASTQTDTSLTLSGDLLGTLRYMSPEQAFGEANADARTDIYSLGVTLYELLTLRPAVEGNSRVELIKQLEEREPRSPRSIDPRIPRDLEKIVLKAIAKDPLERFATAGELADDLQRFLEEKPIQAKRPTLTQRITKWSRRHKPLVATAAVVLVLFVAGLAVSNFLIARQRNTAQTNFSRAETARQQAVTNFNLAETQRMRAEESEEQGRHRLVRLTIANGMRHLDSGELLSSLPWFTEALRLDHADAARAHLHRMRIRSALQHCPKLVWMWYHEGPVTFETGTMELKLSTNAEFSPDGRFVVAPSGRMKAGNWTARVWDTTTGQVVHVLTHDRPVLYASFSDDGRMIATTSGDLGWGPGGFAIVWDARTGKQITNRPLVHGNAVVRASFSPDGSRLVTGSLDKTARVWNVRTGEPVTPPMEHVARVNAVSFSPDGRRVVTASRDWTIWDAATGQPLTKLSTGGSSGVFHASFSPDGSRVVTAGGTAQIWETDSGGLQTPLPHADKVWDASFSPDGRWVVTSSADETAQVWDAATGRPVGAPMSHRSGVTQAQFSPDSRHVVTASWDRTARVWEASTGRPITLPLKHGGDVMCAAFSPDGSRIVTASTDLLVRVWDLANLKGNSRSIRHSNLDYDRTFTAKFSPDGRYVVTAGADRSARVWDASTREPITPPLKHDGAIRHAAFSADSHYVLTTSDDGTARIWDAAIGQPTGAPLKHDGTVVHGSFSPNGGRVATASDDGTARVWDVLTGNPIVTYQHSRGVRMAWFDPDGHRVLTCSHDATARVWDAVTATPITPPLNHYSAVVYTCFSADGRRVLTTSNDGTARVWDAVTGEPISPPLWHGQSIWRGAFSPDGRRVATASNDNTAQVWDAVTGAPLTPPLGWEPHNPHDVSFSPDGRLIVVAWSGGYARVWDAVTGQPLMGQLRHCYTHVHRAEFSPDGQRLLTASRDGTARLWDLLPDDRPIEDLVLLAQVLCGHRIDATGASLVPVEPRALRDAWQSLRGKYSADFVVSPEDLFTWHREEAYECERLQRWNDAIEHLEAAQQYADAPNRSQFDETHARLRRLRTKSEETSE